MDCDAGKCEGLSDGKPSEIFGIPKDLTLDTDYTLDIGYSLPVSTKKVYTFKRK